jgi:hypothetical protein
MKDYLTCRHGCLMHTQKDARFLHMSRQQQVKKTTKIEGICTLIMQERKGHFEICREMSMLL